MNDNLKQEVINLLPWYHLGKLTDEERTLVEEALETDPSLNEISLLEKQTMHKVQADSTLLDGSIFDTPTSRLDMVLAKLDQLEQPAAPIEAPKPTTSTKKPSLFSQIKEYFDNLLAGNSQSFTYAVFAALTVVQLSLLVLFILPSDNMDDGRTADDFETASFLASERPDRPVVNSDSGPMVLLVGMEKHLEVEGLTGMLGGEVAIKLLPNDSNYYRISLSKKLSSQEIEELKNELSKKHGKIWFIGEEGPN